MFHPTKTMVEIGGGPNPVNWEGDERLRVVGLDPVYAQDEVRATAERTLVSNPLVADFSLVGFKLGQVDFGRAVKADEVLAINVFGCIDGALRFAMVENALKLCRQDGEVVIIEHIDPRKADLDGVANVFEKHGLTPRLWKNGQGRFDKICEQRINGRFISAAAQVLTVRASADAPKP